MKNEYALLIEKDEDGYYVGSIPALPGCHSQARSVDQLMERMEEAIALWLEVEQDTDSSRLEWVGI
ncbi:MAG: type II toxin-antitoxin system HicB family antitoxin [Acidiferrobacterales bacterium]|nr:type II toxin-antitoxin system HicB family antitoxin [Acidiferrobacterales bacterium]